MQSNLTGELNYTIEIDPMFRNCAGPKIPNSESSLNHFHKGMLPRLLINLTYFSYFDIKQLKNNLKYIIEQSKTIVQCRKIF